MSDPVEAILAHPNLPYVVSRLVVMEETGHDFESWCSRLGKDESDPVAWEEFNYFHKTYMDLWHDLGTEKFWALMEAERRRQEQERERLNRQIAHLEKKARKAMEKVR